MTAIITGGWRERVTEDELERLIDEGRAVHWRDLATSPGYITEHYAGWATTLRDLARDDLSRGWRRSAAFYARASMSDRLAGWALGQLLDARSVIDCPACGGHGEHGDVDRRTWTECYECEGAGTLDKSDGDGRWS